MTTPRERHPTRSENGQISLIPNVQFRAAGLDEIIIGVVQQSQKACNILIFGMMNCADLPLNLSSSKFRGKRGS